MMQSDPSYQSFCGRFFSAIYNNILHRMKLLNFFLLAEISNSFPPNTFQNIICKKFVSLCMYKETHLKQSTNFCINKCTYTFVLREFLLSSTQSFTPMFYKQCFFEFVLETRQKYNFIDQYLTTMIVLQKKFTRDKQVDCVGYSLTLCNNHNVD